MESVKAVEHDPYRFGLEIDEVERRRRLVKDVGDEIENMRDELQHTIQDAKNKGKGAANGDGLPDPDSFEDEDNYAAYEQEQQLEMMNQQDEALDGVFRTVGNLRQQADDMGRELEEQGEMLNEVDTVADRVGGKLQTGIKKVGWVIKKNEGMLAANSCMRRVTNMSCSRSMVQLLYRSTHIRLDIAVGTAVDTLSKEPPPTSSKSPANNPMKSREAAAPSCASRLYMRLSAIPMTRGFLCRVPSQHRRLSSLPANLDRNILP